MSDRLSLAQQVASALRLKIERDELPDGSILPPLDVLGEEFGVGRVSMRQALQLLESDGLLSVRRGRHGGSVVIKPASDGIGDVDVTRGLTGVSAEDLAQALSELEPVCAALCSRRPDREQAVLPHLRRVHELGRAAIANSPAQWPALARRFHEELVARCGNATVTSIIGAVEALCSQRAAVWARTGVDQPDFPTHDERFQRRGLDDHALILTFIERGDAEAAAREARRHLQWVPPYSIPVTEGD